MKKTKKSQELPINIVVMLIIGIIIFGLGISMFSKFSSKGEEKISDLSNQIKTDIANLECNSNEWICSPSYKIRNGDSKTFQIFIVNNAQTVKDFSVNLDLVNIDSKQGLTKSDCGSIIIGYYKKSIKILSSQSASIPFEIIASRVKKTPCSFVTTATLHTNPSGETGDNEKTAIIIRIE